MDCSDKGGQFNYFIEIPISSASPVAGGQPIFMGINKLNCGGGRF